jgi:hypothetical protein
MEAKHIVSKVPKRLSLAQIRTATMGFNQNRIVGEGASATVYRGSLPSGLAVAAVQNPYRSIGSVI